MGKNIVIDVDDVLAGNNDIIADKVGGSVYDLTRWITDAIPERFAYYNDPEFVRSQPVAAGAQEFVQELQSLGFDVCVCTAVPMSVVKERMEWIEEHFPSIKKQNIMIASRKDLIAADILLDDGPHNIKNSIAKYPILFRKPWNKEVTGTLAVNNFDEAVAMIHNLIVPRTEADDRFVCIVGPSGAGKSEIVHELCENGYIVPKILTSSRRTQPYYQQVTKKEFENLKDKGVFAETSAYADEYYGILTTDIEYALEYARKNKRKIVVPIDICGANILKYKFGAQIVFIDREKEILIKNVLSKSISDQEKTFRILALDTEKRNAEICDRYFMNTNSTKTAAAIIG